MVLSIPRKQLCAMYANEHHFLLIDLKWSIGILIALTWHHAQICLKIFTSCYST